MKYGCIGEKLGHSFSLEIHEKIGLYDYVLKPLAREEVPGFLKKRDFLGINVTIPYKKDVMPHLSEISPEAALCGAVNTVVNRGGRLMGYNTDFLGMKELLAYGKIPISGKKVLILGSGGTSGTAQKLCESLGAERINRVSRSGRDGCLTYEEALRLSDTQIILNTTPCGMYPDLEGSPISLEGFPSLEGVLDAVYNPAKTTLLQDAEKRGISHIGGLYMLVSQAVHAASIFTGREDLLCRIEPIFREMEEEKRNLVLIGMPGCGKSTLGRILARRLGKELIDSDEEIEKETGKKIPALVAREGETAFRDAESRVIRRLSALRGKVIATGGGAVLRRENVEYLRGNGTLNFLDAPLHALTATSSRPLSSTREDLEKRYRERIEIYAESADIRVPVTRDEKENVERIRKVLG